MPETPRNLQAMFAGAVRQYQAGQINESQKTAEAILSLDSRHADSIHLLGMIAYRQGRVGQAQTLLEAALKLHPDSPSILGLLGHVLCAANRFDDALAVAARLLAIRPLEGNGWMLRGAALAGMARMDEALASFDKAVLLMPASVEAIFRRGAAWKALGRRVEAIKDFDNVLQINPRFAEAHLSKGNALMEDGRPAEALDCFDQAISLKPDYAIAYNNKGNALFALENPCEAVNLYTQAIAADANLAEAYNNRANALKAQDLLAEAVLDYDRAITLKPDHAAAFCNKGNTLQKLGRFDEALSCYDRAIAINPRYADAYANRAVALSNLGRNREAIDDYRLLIHMYPDEPQPYYDLAVTLLRTEQFPEGWRLFEWRKKLPRAMNFRKGPQPLWLGQTPAAGKTLLVEAEQGLGDTIQFCRYVPQLSAVGAKVFFSVQDSLVRLLSGSFPEIQIIGASEEPPNFDHHIPLLSLPPALGVTKAESHLRSPYLFAEQERVAKWKERIQGPEYKVGINWQGNKDSPADIGRSLPLRHFECLSKIPNLRLISLQKGYGLQQLRDLSGKLRIDTPGYDFDEGRDAFLDTAAIMQNLDLVITSDTAIAHLAGALGRPVWLALQYWPDWRWFLEKSDSPWYPTMRLFRQKRPGDWAEVFEEIKAALDNLGRGGC